MYIRKRHRIMDLETGEVEDFNSINKAKKKSRELQLKNGGLGLGSVKLGNFPKKKRML